MGVMLTLLGVMSLAGVFVADAGMLISPAAVAVRYVLMCIAGIGFALLYKWAIGVYLLSLTINWITFFTIYDQQAIGPLWATIPIPVLICLLTGLAWKRLKPASR